MAAVVGIVNVRGLSIHTRHGNNPNKSKLVLYKPLIHCNSHLHVVQLYLSNKMERFSYKGRRG